MDQFLPLHNSVMSSLKIKKKVSLIKYTKVCCYCVVKCEAVQGVWILQKARRPCQRLDIKNQHVDGLSVDISGIFLAVCAEHVVCL